MNLKAPFPWFGGKRRVANLVWQRFGQVRNFVEPFFGSGAVLLGRPLPFDGTETVNDKDSFVCNAWRAIQNDPEGTAGHADAPVNESDLHAKHVWLVERRDGLQARLEADPDYFDQKIAGYWLWGMACWIGSGFCSGKGPWQVVEKDGVRQLVHLGDAGLGVNRKLVHLGNAGQGVNRKRERTESLLAYFAELADRLRGVRVCCGDWCRVMGETPMLTRGSGFTPVGVFLDPPYADEADRDNDLYRVDRSSAAVEGRWRTVTDDLQPLDIRCDHKGHGEYWCDSCKPCWRCTKCYFGVEFGEAVFKMVGFGIFCPKCGGELEANPGVKNP